MSAFLTASLVLSLRVFSFMVVSADQRIIRTEPGDNVILTCREAENKDVIVVQWSRTDLESDKYVLLYRDSQFYPEGQSPSFSNRVSLLDVKNGDVSLVLKDVTTDDTGTYECRVVQRGKNRRKRSQLDTEPIRSINLRVKPGNQDGGNEEGPKEDGGSWPGLILLGLLALVSLAINVLLCRKREHLCQQQKTAGVELVPMNPENRPPAEE